MVRYESNELFTIRIYIGDYAWRLMVFAKRLMEKYIGRLVIPSIHLFSLIVKYVLYFLDFPFHNQYVHVELNIYNLTLDCLSILHRRQDCL